MPVTIREVAKAAGVSITTVSRALNGYDDVSEETRRRIAKVAMELNYRPSVIARNLVTKRTRMIGVLVSELTRWKSGHYFLFQVLYGMHDRLAELGFDMMLVSTTTTKQQEISYLDFCTERRLAGVIAMGLKLDDPYLHEIVDSPMPSVMIDVPLLSDHCGYVMTDNVHGAKLAMRHLFSRGHQRIGFVNGHNQAAVSKDRLRGYMEAHEAAGIPFDMSLVRDADFTVEGGRDAALSLLEEHVDMTGIFFASDLMAIGCLHHMNLTGVKIPDQLAIVGFDDIDLTEFVSPRLTTVRQKRFEMGIAAAEMLISMLNGTGAPQGQILVPELVVRETT